MLNVESEKHQRKTLDSPLGICYFLGWGTTEFSGPKTDTLQAVDLVVVPYSRCAEELPDNVIGASQMWHIGRLVQVRIISYGLACATDIASVNTRMTTYLKWIVSVTNGKNMFFYR